MRPHVNRKTTFRPVFVLKSIPKCVRFRSVLLLFVCLWYRLCHKQQNPLPTNKPGVEPKRPSRPVNITTLCKLSPIVSNQISISWAADYNRPYAVGVFLVEKLASHSLLQRVKQKGVRNSDHTRAMSESSFLMNSIWMSFVFSKGKAVARPRLRNRNHEFEGFSSLSSKWSIDYSKFLTKNSLKSWEKWEFKSLVEQSLALTSSASMLCSICKWMRRNRPGSALFVTNQQSLLISPSMGLSLSYTVVKDSFESFVLVFSMRS